ncbi:hypothetical protein F5X99DRAFT_410631 [Biscogniauxia marginata]|nr:hypothetical protein F5X99DRAFT_410631 [Biscogniauxia marginata]
MATFMAVASLFLAAEAIPGATNKQARDAASPSVYKHPGFVPSSTNETVPSLKARFEADFKGTGNQQFTCQSMTVKSDPNPGAKISDCRDGMADLLKMPGYWDCKDWVKDNNFHFFELYGKGTCHFSVAGTKDSPTSIGNGDVYAFIYKTVTDYAQGDSAAAQGTMQCGDNKIYWSVSSKVGA